MEKSSWNNVHSTLVCSSLRIPLGWSTEGGRRLSEPLAYLAMHVDDVLMIGDNQLCQLLKKLLSQVFPIDDWETDAFEYIGSYSPTSRSKRTP